MKKNIYPKMKIIFLIFCFCLCSPYIQAADSISDAKALGNAFNQVAENAGKAVVAITTVKTLSTHDIMLYSPGQNIDPFYDEFFRDFFGGMPNQEQKQKGLGSGVIIDKEGHIITNEHVIHSADEIEISLPDGRVFKATLQGSDMKSDLAILKIDTKGVDIPTAPLGDSDLVKIGEWAIAIGNPFGFMVGNSLPTLTVGIISALHRNIDIDGVVEENRYYGNLIQTDAAINPGNSGGPLVNIDGQVIGINTLIFSHTGGYQGVGFAIPINKVKNIINDLIAGKKVVYGWLGVWIQPLDEEMVKAFDLQNRGGALIFKIEEGSPAEKADLKQGDIITAINNKAILNPQSVINQINEYKAGSIIELSLIRDKQPLTKNVTIGIRPEEAKMLPLDETSPQDITWRGITVKDITEEVKRKLNIINNAGVVITNVSRQSKAFLSGLSPFDLIDEVNRTTIKNLNDFNNVTKEATGNVLIHTNKGYFVIPKE